MVGSKPMNLMLFTAAEWGLPLDPRDDRVVHMAGILGLAPGDWLRVGVLDRGWAEARFLGWDKRIPRLEFPPLETLRPAPAMFPLNLILGHPRPPVLQRLFKDLNSLGTARIQVVRSELSEASYMSSSIWKDQAWERHLLQGAMQGGLCTLSQVDRFWSLQKCLTQLPAQGQRICLDFGAIESSLLAWAWARSGSIRGPGSTQVQVHCAVGPERGWSDSERRILGDAGFSFLGLGPCVLRTEAACTIAAGILVQAMAEGQTAWGGLKAPQNHVP